MNMTFTLAHLSDLHLSSLKNVRLRELLNKRIYGYLNWLLRRGREHRKEIVEALLRDLPSTEPDHIAVTGDLTHLGLPKEFQQAEQFLHSLGSPSQVTVIPGNHDTYVSTDWNHTFSLWADYMVSDTAHFHAAPGKNFRSTFPSLRVRGLAALIGVSSARPSAPFLATGRIGHVQLAALEKILAETSRQQLFRIVLIHHPPVPGTVSWRKRLTDGTAFRSTLARHGAELVIHGHAHHSSLTQLETPAGWVPSIGVPSASALGRKPNRRARYHIYRLGRNADVWEMVLSVRSYAPQTKSFIEENKSHLVLPHPLGYSGTAQD